MFFIRGRTFVFQQKDEDSYMGTTTCFLNAYGIGGVGVTVDPLVAEMAMTSSKR